MSYNIIDRRLNPGGKSIGNRQRFIKRAKESLKRSVKDGLLDRSITDDGEQNVSVPTDGIYEPSFHHDPYSGTQRHILPGNKDLVVGDIIEKPPQGGGSGRGQQGAPDGEGEDEFGFAISKDEFTDILFDGLELPDLKKKSMKEAVSFANVRAGFVNDGTPNNLDLYHSMRRSLGRRIALKKPKVKEIKKLQSELFELEDLDKRTPEQTERLLLIQEMLKSLESKKNAISFLDPIDLRYRNYDKVPKPKHNAVMFCVMDVSASMGSEEKDLAKRFYMLLYLFLQYKYDKVDVIYIRHHSRATECTEEEFFYSRETGGTLVSTGFEVMMDVIKDRYNIDEWNIYVAQASDGDNFASDNENLVDILTKQVLPITQYFAYIEVSGLNSYRSLYYRGAESEYGLWPVYRDIQTVVDNLEMRRVSDPRHVYSVFRDFFTTEEQPNG